MARHGVRSAAAVLAVAITLCLVGCASVAREPSKVVSQGNVATSSPTPPLLPKTRTSTGLSFAMPEGWAMRADEFDFFAAWPSSFGGAKDSDTDFRHYPDGVRVYATDDYLTISDRYSGRDALKSAVARMRAEGFKSDPQTDVRFVGHPAKAVVGRARFGTEILIVSTQYVVEGHILHNAPASGLTTENVVGVLDDVGLQGDLWKP